jgi:hypothetical protein
MKDLRQHVNQSPRSMAGTLEANGNIIGSINIQKTKLLMFDSAMVNN